jgi:hypothetical protein
MLLIGCLHVCILCDAHFRCSFINSSLVILGALIELLLSLNTFSSRWQSRTLNTFISIHSVNFTYFHTFFTLEFEFPIVSL